MISNKTNKAVIHEILEDFAKKGVDQLMIADAQRLHRSGSLFKNPLYPLSLSSLNSVVKKDLRNNAHITHIPHPMDLENVSF